MKDINYPVGFTIFQLDGDNNYTITGRFSKEYRFKDFDGAYDFEEWLERHIDCSEIDFDSEYCQFFAYTKTVDRAKKFVEDLTDFAIKIRALID